MSGEDFYPKGKDSGDNDGDTAADTKPEDKPDSNTALVPKSLFGENPPEVGTECKIRVAHVFEDEVEIEYVKADKSEKTDKKPNMEEAEAKLGEMATMTGE